MMLESSDRVDALLRPKKINVLFPVTSPIFSWSVGRQTFFFIKTFLYRKSIKILTNV